MLPDPLDNGKEKGKVAGSYSCVSPSRHVAEGLTLAGAANLFPYAFNLSLLVTKSKNAAVSCLYCLLIIAQL